jgi:serine protease AprX
VALIALASPLAATAAPAKKKPKPKAPVVAVTPKPSTPAPAPAPSQGSQSSNDKNDKWGKNSYVSTSLKDRAERAPESKIRVIIQSRKLTDAEKATEKLGVLARMLDEHPLVGAMTVELTANQIAFLSKVSNLIITPDDPVRVTDLGSTLGSVVNSLTANKQLWPYEAGNSFLWGTSRSPAPQAPTIAIVDSGVDTTRSDFAGRIVADVKMSTLEGANSAGDSRGHGTFVAGIAAGSGKDYAGAAPNAKLVSIDVMNDQGMARTSDVIAAAEWILTNRVKYGIRVANFSLHATHREKFWLDPLNRAVEKLWRSGVVVVAAAGNYGLADGPSGVLYAPGNDPFVITVGAVDIGRSARIGDDSVAPWSAYGYTLDGFRKPELGAPGRYMAGPVARGSMLTVEKAANLIGLDYIQLSGTSFAAPVVAGAAAQLLALHPTWTPDQVKGALMVTARDVPGAAEYSAGVGQVHAYMAALVKNPPNPNAALNAFLSSSGSGSEESFDGEKWAKAVQSDASWSSASWSSASWSDASWSSASWSDASWSSASWSSASWSDASWSSASWTDSSREDAAEGDAAQELPQMTPEQEQEILSDDTLDLPADTLEGVADAIGGLL